MRHKMEESEGMDSPMFEKGEGRKGKRGGKRKKSRRGRKSSRY